MHLITPRLAAVPAGTHMFRRRNMIVLTAGITIALIVAMAGPADARTWGG